MSDRHKVFISYHHANDQNYRNIFQLRFGNRLGAVIPGAVDIGDIDPNLPDETIRKKIRDEYLRDTSVTVVLIGTQTWQRRHVDWEIASSLRNTQLNPRSGLLGLFLPSHPSFGDTKYDPGKVPPRLHDNAECGYAVMVDWTEDPDEARDLVHSAYKKKRTVTPNQSRPLFKYNRSGERWS